MQDKILNYAKNPLSPPDPAIEKWLADHLNAAEEDSLFEAIYRNAPRIDDLDGKQEMLRLLDSVGAGRKRNSSLAPWLSVAAMSILLVWMGLHLWKISRQPAQKWDAEFASYGQTRDITLPDNTKIWLHNDSRVIFPDHFYGKKRTIFADGEIYAEVHADEAHPFIIDTKGAKVRVLGTTFNLSSYSSGGKVALTLLKGKVDIDVPVLNRELHFSLEPGDQLTVDRNTGEYAQAKVDVSSFNLWKNSRKFYFIDRPLKEIVMELQEAFGTPILAKDARLLETRYLASFINNETLDAILEALNADGKMRIIKKENTYYLYPNY